MRPSRSSNMAKWCAKTRNRTSVGNDIYREGSTYTKRTRGGKIESCSSWLSWQIISWQTSRSKSRVTPRPSKRKITINIIERKQSTAWLLDCQPSANGVYRYWARDICRDQASHVVDHRCWLALDKPSDNRGTIIGFPVWSWAHLAHQLLKNDFCQPKVERNMSETLGVSRFLQLLNPLNMLAY